MSERREPPPLAPPSTWPDPYRILFPIGVAFALWGAVVWLLTAFGWTPYPGPEHRTLMMQGFEMSFVLGFLLTAMPGFTRGQKFRPFELAGAAVAMLALGGCVGIGALAAAATVFAASVAWVVIALVRRVVAARALPPEEFAFVGLGLATGMVGGVWLAGVLAGAWGEPVPGFAARLVSLGMVLPLVLGIGGLLVPAFAGIRQPLAIPGIASAHQRRGRRPLYLAVVLVLVASFVADALRAAAVGPWLRALAGTVMLLWVWKLPGAGVRHDLYAITLRLAGWCALLGLWIHALVPRLPLAGLHVLFIGGFGLLTMAIATRVVIAHGGHPPALDRRVLGPLPVGLVLLAAVLRVWSELRPAGGMHALATSGALWTVAWLWWSWRAVPLIARVAPRPELVQVR